VSAVTHRPVIGRMHADDVAAVHAIERASQRRPWSRSLLAAEVGAADRDYLVARVDGRVVGYAGVMVAVDEAHVLTVAVHPDHRRRGLATALLTGALAAAAERGATAATLEVRESDDGAQALYRRLGFVAAGVRPGYYCDEGAVIMWSHDLPRAGDGRLPCW
jgi:[ribosomal protein S18]-alanine N-acetyltransferase